MVGLCLSVGLFFVTFVTFAEPIEMPFGTWTRQNPRKHVSDGGAHWRHLANTTEPPMCGADAACCQITWQFDDVLLWPPYVIGQAIIFLPCGFFFLSLYVYHTSTHGVALVRI